MSGRFSKVLLLPVLLLMAAGCDTTKNAHFLDVAPNPTPTYGYQKTERFSAAEFFGAGSVATETSKGYSSTLHFTGITTGQSSTSLVVPAQPNRDQVFSFSYSPNGDQAVAFDFYFQGFKKVTVMALTKTAGAYSLHMADSADNSVLELTNAISKTWTLVTIEQYNSNCCSPVYKTTAEGSTSGYGPLNPPGGLSQSWMVIRNVGTAPLDFHLYNPTLSYDNN